MGICTSENVIGTTGTIGTEAIGPSSKRPKINGLGMLDLEKKFQIKGKISLKNAQIKRLFS